MICKKPFRVIKGLDKNQYPYGLEVPCGKCLYCRINKRKELAIRMVHEKKYHAKTSFITLTYSDDNLPRAHNTDEILDTGTLIKKDFVDFAKRLRKNLEPNKIKMFGSGEYGDKYLRPHYHAIIFGVNYDEQELIKSIWKKGDVFIGTALPESMNYVAGYIDKKYSGPLEKQIYHDTGRENVFRYMSKGLGKQYAIENEEQLKQQKYITFRGVKHSIPRYYLKVLNIDIEERKEELKEIQRNFNYEITGQKITDDQMIGTMEGNTEGYLAWKKQKKEIMDFKRKNIDARKAIYGQRNQKI